MKKLLFVVTILIGLGFSACSKGVDTSKEDYERANKASKEALKSLDKE